jgi:signal transduction histidine kinase
MNKLVVLVVDDEPGIRSGIHRVLRNFTVGYPFMDDDFEYECIDASTGEEAIDILKSKQQVDIVLLDNQLPGIEGIEVLEFINKQQFDVEVMMITSYASLDLAVKATNKGAYNFVPKPFTPQELKSSIENITKHLFLKRMTRKMNKQGREIRFQFLSVLSHELKSPINAIEGYLKIMQERQAGDSLENYEAMIDRSILRIKAMRSLIMDLLDITKIESGKKDRHLKKVDLTEHAHLAMDTVEPLAIQRNVKIHFNAPDKLVYNGDSEEIDIIFNNLLSNAVKYNREGGDVYCNIKKCEDHVLICVEDTGIGIAAEDLPRLFQEFSRIKNSKTRNITGTGLGLSILKKMVDLNGGEIDVKSEPDVGTKFCVKLPA